MERGFLDKQQIYFKRGDKLFLVKHVIETESRWAVINAHFNISVKLYCNSNYYAYYAVIISLFRLFLPVTVCLLSGISLIVWSSNMTTNTEATFTQHNHKTLDTNNMVKSDSPTYGDFFFYSFTVTLPTRIVLC